MISKKVLLRKSVLYVILDKHITGKKPLEKAAVEIRDSGADIVQLRDKLSDKRAVFEEAGRLRRIFAGSRTVFIINDYPDIARALKCDGVHLGQRDMPIAAARAILGRQMIIGISCETLPQALEAQKQGADYIGIGPVFPTSTKTDAEAIGLELIRQCSKRIRIPFFAIGGIDTKTLPEVLNAGARRICVCSAILNSPNIPLSVSELNNQLKTNKL
jgi:thiamine-phosphate pyrophosphorylase